MKRSFTLLFILATFTSFAQKLETLTVEKIMRDPKWIGPVPTNVQWSDDSKKVYFNWVPDHAPVRELFAVTTANTTPVKVSLDEQKDLSRNGQWNKKHSLKVFERNGDLFLSEPKTGKVIQLTQTNDRESNPAFSGDESRIIFTRNDNLYALKLSSGGLVQLTNFVAASPAGAATAKGRRGAAAASSDTESGSEQERWLKAQQLELFTVIKENAENKKLDAAERKALQAKKLKEMVTGGRSIDNLGLSPDGRYVTYRLIKAAEGEKNAIVPSYVTASGFTEDIPNRTKVGAPQFSSESCFFVWQRGRV
jgi:Tol biopolymer transport system component